VQAFMSCPPLPAEACGGWLRQAAARSAGPPLATTLAGARPALGGAAG
jgi:hypothetical protein